MRVPVGRARGRSLALLVLLSWAAAAPASERTYAWVQYVAGGVEVRAVAAARAGADGTVETRAGCPILQIDGVEQPMAERQLPAGALGGTAGEFPVAVCTARLPPHAARVTVDGTALPLPKARPVRIALLGDTGCRTPLEDCTSTWALPAVAQAIAARRPDLIIHLGDYLYRERGCLIDLCGYGWLPWRADFMDAAADWLFPAAPLILVRGNHEGCGRAAKGWFLLFDADPPPAQCPGMTRAWSVDIGSANLVVTDNAAADDRLATDVAIYRNALEAAGIVPGRPNWIIGHRPVWGAVGGGHWLNATLQAAYAGRLSDVSLILSGHIHTTELIEMSGRPGQLILGTGGADLAAAVPADTLIGTSAAGAVVTRAYTRAGYGFALLEEEGGVWRISVIDDQNRLVVRCDAALRCAAP